MKLLVVLVVMVVNETEVPVRTATPGQMEDVAAVVAVALTSATNPLVMVDRVDLVQATMMLFNKINQ